MYGAAPIPLELLRQAVETIPNAGFMQCYGMTETTGTVVVLPPEDHTLEGNPRMRAAGKAIPGVEVKIVGPDGEELPRGEVGEIVTRSANNMLGYWNLPDATAQTLSADGWVRTGDAATMDEDGYIYIQDRMKDMIISGGENVYPAEVESAIYGHPDIAEVAVIGVPDERWGEAVKACVVPKPGARIDEAERDRLCPRADRGVQGAQVGRRDRGAAAQPLRQDPAPGAARALLGRARAAGELRRAAVAWTGRVRLSQFRAPAWLGAVMAFAPFVPLRILSSYTMLEGAIDPKAIARLATERGFPAIAICDRNGLYGVVPFAAAAREKGVQPIIGALLAVARPERGGVAKTGFGPAEPTIDWLALYAQDEAGWNNLCHLVSAAHLGRPVEQPPHVTLADLVGPHRRPDRADRGGRGRAGAALCGRSRPRRPKPMPTRLAELFGDRLYIELARRGDAVEEAAEDALIELAYARNLPLVATNPASFDQPGFHAAHDAMLCIAASTHVDSPDRARSGAENWVKSAPMMAELFEDLPEALANTLVVAQRCAFAPPKRKPILPSLAGDAEGEARALAEDARAGLAARLRPISRHRSG